MTKAKRFVYISAPNGKVAHMLYGKLTEGEPTKCGIRVQKGWQWRESWPGIKRCKRCSA